MRNVQKFLLKSLPLLVLITVLFVANDSYAGVLDFFSELKDKAVNAVKDAALSALGIDTSDNCATPVPADSTFCLFCPMFKILFNAGSIIAGKTYTAFSSDLGKLVLVFLAVSLALIILRNIASFGAKDPSALINDIFQKAFIGIVIFFIINKDYYNILNLTLTPLFESGLSFVSGRTTCVNATNILGFTSGINSLSPGGLPVSIGQAIVCAVEDIENKINTLFEFGKWAFCRGMGPDRVLYILPNPIYIVDGILLYFAGICFMVAYPWVMADAVLQLGISFALLPFAVCGYAFNGTKNYLKTLFSWILHSLFTFMFMSILILCILGYINSLLLGTLENGNADPRTVFLNPNDGVAFYGWNMIKIIFVLLIGWLYMPLISDLAGKFSEGAGLTAGAATGQTVRKSVENTANKVAGKSADIAKTAATTVGRVTQRRAKAAVRQTIQHSVNTFGTANGAGGKTVKMFGVTFSTEKNADGSQVLRREWVNPVNGRKHVMIADKYSTIRQEYTANGKLIRNEVQFKHNFAKKYLVDKTTGNINTGAVKALLDSPAAQNPEYRKAIMEQIAINVSKARGGPDMGKYFKSRDVMFDPRDPNKILFVQKDYEGKTTTMQMEIDPSTGQTAIAYEKNDRKGHVMVVDNGLVKVTNINGVMTTKYSAYAMQEHDDILATTDGNQVVERNGSIAADLNPANAGMSGYKGNLMMGMNNILGVQNIGGIAAEDYMRNNIFAEGRRRKTNKFKTNFNIDNERAVSFIANNNSDIIATIDVGGVVRDLSGTVLAGIPADSHII